ncbi:hypothetical protein V8B55DRAFT_1541114 [Mucor lusitanicus]|uniref:Uncharacterized protein n=2 Tax=Mucor circinelloides f. lusitanicus TaxID=29924 RepID=A0A162Z9P9_MUCCL|nr:hypothetical protein FB192DRAFT_1388259 [Mucor lusitanicus]OAD06137.1 hypothetical protein MUCCIDRAFT_155250 [Mucor lusitanicus CBS 277.49]
MEKSSKAEYVAVPTSDVEQEVGLPPYQEQEQQESMTADKTKRRRRLRFLLIGGAITLLGLTHVCTSDSYDGFSEMNAMDLRPQDAPEPCALRHLEQYKELKHHMEFVENAFGEPTHGAWDAYPPPPFAIDEPKPHHRHHKHHKDHKDHKGKKHHHEHHHDNGDAPKGDEKPHHRHHHKHKGDKIDGAVQKFDGDHHKHHYEPFCKAEDLISKSSVFEFSPEEFKRAGILSGGFFDKGSHIVLSKSSDASLKNVRVNVTVSAGREDLGQEVKVSAFDHDGEYSVQVEHGYFHHPRHHRAIKDVEENDHHRGDHGPKKEDCLIYDINVEFPADLDYFDQLNVKAKGGFLKNGKGIEGVEFGSIRAAIGRGAVIFDGLRAKNLLLGVFRGVVMGTYQPSETFSAGTVHGASKVKIEPTSDNINITASSTFGPASVDIPADSFKGRFALFNLFGEPSTIEAPNPEDIHVQKFKPTIKSGYYKEDNEESRVVVAAKLKGGERLTFY